MLDVPRTQELVVCVGARAGQNNGVLQVSPGAGRLLSMSMASNFQCREWGGGCLLAAAWNCGSESTKS